MTAIRTENLNISYGNIDIVKNLNMEIPKGKITTIIGANGCGKSTILKTIARIITPKSGDIYVNETNIKEQSSKELAKTMAVLPQSPQAPKDLTVEELIAYGRFPHQKGFGKLKKEVESVNEAFDKYNSTRTLLQQLSDEQVAGASNFKTLKFELEALNALDLKEGDYETINRDYDALMHQSQAQDAIALAQGVLENDEHNIIDILSSRISDLSKVAIFAKDSINPIIDDLSNAATLLDAAREKLDSLSLKANPALVDELSEKLAKCHELSRRFNVQPNELYKIKDKLEKDLEHFLSLKEQIAKLTSLVKQYRDDYEQKALELSKKRIETALLMSKEVTDSIKTLALENGVFKVQVEFDTTCRPRKNGRDNVTFLFSANLGQEPLELGTVASGGELSRLALAIEVLTSFANDTNTLVFDEVDTGISGRTASAVGALLRKLGKNVQVITVTHLPQVAACAHHQFLVTKEQADNEAQSHVKALDEEGRITELSRMMGGNVVTAATKDSARALLKESAL